MPKTLFKYYLYIVFIFYFIVNIVILDNLPFGFDYDYYQAEVKHIKNPLLTWFPCSNYYKSWPLTYNILWIYNYFFGDSVVVPRFINLGLHFVNFLLLRKIIGTERIAQVVSLLFLFNPLSTLTIAWTFQLKTILAMTFLLLLVKVTMKETYTKKDLGKIVSLFWLGINTKVIAILYPFYFLFANRTKYKEKNIIGTSAGLLFIAFVYGLLNIKGVAYFVKEMDYLKKDSFKNEVDAGFKNSEIADDARSTGEEGVNLKIDVLKEMQVGGTEYVSSFVSLDRFIPKHIIATQNFGRLILSSLGLNRYFPFYEQNSKTIEGSMIYLYSLIAILTLCLIVHYRSQWGVLALTIFLPISGYFYVPYMKFSYSSDHWFYPAMPFILIFLYQLIKKPAFWAVVSLSVSVSYLYNTYQYRSFQTALSDNFNHNRNKVVLESLIYYAQLEGNKKSMLNLSRYILDNEVYFKKSYYDVIYDTSISTDKLNVLKRYFPRKVSNILENQDQNELESHLKMHDPILSERTSDLIRALTSVNSNTIDKNLYSKTLNHLGDKEDQP